MVSFMSFRRTYCGSILSVPSGSTSIKDEDLEGTDKILPKYVQQKDMKDNIWRYIVLIPEEKANICQRDSEWWRVLGACTYIVIDDGVTSIVNAFYRGSSRIGEITFLRTCPFWQLKIDLHDNYY